MAIANPRIRHEPEVRNTFDRGFKRGLPRCILQGVRVGCDGADRSLMMMLLAAMRTKPSSLTCVRLPTSRAPELVAFLDVWNDQVARQIIEAVRLLMIEAYYLHVSGYDAAGGFRGLVDCSPRGPHGPVVAA